MRPVSPPVSGPELVDALERHGFVVVATVGAHSALRGRSPGQAVVVPLHDELSHAALASVLRKAGCGLGQPADPHRPPGPPDLSDRWDPPGRPTGGADAGTLN